MHWWLLALQTLHSNRNVIFFVVFAFLWKIGLVCPPNPCCFRSYRRFPWAKLDALPALYWVTLCSVCLRHFLQWVFFFLGALTIWRKERSKKVQQGRHRGKKKTKIGERSIFIMWWQGSYGTTIGFGGRGEVCGVESMLLWCGNDVVKTVRCPLELVDRVVFFLLSFLFRPHEFVVQSHSGHGRLSWNSVL